MEKYEYPPFENILGKTPELYILDHLIALPNCEFSISEIAKIAKTTKPKTKIIIKKLLNWDLIETVEHNVFKINEKSPLILTLIEFNQQIIKHMFLNEGGIK